LTEELNGAEAPQTDQPTQDDLDGIPEWAHPLVKQYGRSMFALVLNAGMSQQAAAVLNEIVSKHRSIHGQRALAILADAFNQVSNAYAEAKKWDPELLAQCDRDCQLAFSKSVQPVTPAILLAH